MSPPPEDPEESSPDNNPPARSETIKRTPLPVVQLLSVCLIQFAEPITALCIYPFINQFIRETGITGGDETKTGYYGGIIDSIFFLTESMTVVTWGFLSDRYGRRPILLLAPLGLTGAMLMFGLSTTFWPLVVARSLQGMFNGNMGVSRSVIAEITDTTNRADAFSFGSLVWSTGSTTANLMGGLLSNPDKRWPDGIGRIPILKAHPYLLPCASAACLAFFAFAFGFFFLKESLPSLVEKQKQRTTAPTEETPLLGPVTEASPSDTATTTAPPPKFRDALTRTILVPVFCTAFLMFIDMCHSSLLPLVWSTSIANGGLGLGPPQIGATIAAYGLFNALLQVNFAGRVQRHFGVVRVFRVSVYAFLVCFAMYPITNYFARRAGYADRFVFACMLVQLSCNTLVYFAFGAIQVILVESVPRGGPLATANGLAQMAGSGSRTVAPTLATSLFALSIQKNLAGGNLVYYLFLGITAIGIYGTSYLPPDKPKATVNANEAPE